VSSPAHSDRLIRRLADGRFHSGARLADDLGVSRAAVWKKLRRLSADLGIPIDAVPGRGYRLARPLELLERSTIEASLAPHVHARLDRLTLLSTTASTNAEALAGIPDATGLARVWLAEHQTAGRGRRGRQWVSTFGENLYLSLAWRFELSMAGLAGLSLAAGVVLSEALRDLGVQGHSLKWPNDVLLGGRKLGGILVEASGESGGPAAAVIGMGVNFRLSTSAAAAIDQPWASLEQLGGVQISRNQLAARLVERLVAACARYETHGLSPFLNDWKQHDGLRDREVRVQLGPRVIEGVYRGVAPSGAAIIESEQGVSEYHAGEVSMRGADGL